MRKGARRAPFLNTWLESRYEFVEVTVYPAGCGGGGVVVDV